MVVDFGDGDGEFGGWSVDGYDEVRGDGGGRK